MYVLSFCKFTNILDTKYKTSSINNTLKICGSNPFQNTFFVTVVQAIEMNWEMTGSNLHWLLPVFHNLNWASWPNDSVRQVSDKYLCPRSLKSAIHLVLYFFLRLIPTRCVDWGGPVVITQVYCPREALFNAAFRHDRFQMTRASGRMNSIESNIAVSSSSYLA